MLFRSLVFVLAFVDTLVLGAPPDKKGKGCQKPTQRSEWRTLKPKDKRDYLIAVQCLAKKPARHTAEIPGAISRYDEFHGVHVQQTDFIHFVGHFAIWHRYFINSYETALRKDCGWKAGIPYWDWLQDTESGLAMTEWPIFDADTGFGGNGPWVEGNTGFPVPGRTGGGCVQDGPFTFDKFQLSLGPGHNASVRNPHCLKRDFSPQIVQSNLVRSAWDEVLARPDYGAFARRLEAEPSWDVTNVHGGGHFGVGGSLGDMGDPYNSPGDPLFYLHHANLDRLFWEWQEKDLPTRFADVSGPINAFDYANARGGNITLDFEVNLGPLGGAVKLRELMDPKNGPLCYEYV